MKTIFYGMNGARELKKYDDSQKREFDVEFFES